MKIRTSDFLFKDNPKRLKFENTSVSWLEDRYIMDVKLFGKCNTRKRNEICPKQTNLQQTTQK